MSLTNSSTRFSSSIGCDEVQLQIVHATVVKETMLFYDHLRIDNSNEKGGVIIYAQIALLSC